MPVEATSLLEEKRKEKKRKLNAMKCSEISNKSYAYLYVRCHLFA